MADQVTNQGDSTQNPSDDSKNTDNEHMIPKSRFDKINDKAKDLEDKLKKIEEERQKDIEARLVEQQQYKELAEKRGKELAEIQAKAQKVDAYEQTLTAVYEASLQELPEDMRDLVPDELNTQQKLNWLSKNKSRLLKPISPDLGAGKRGGGGSSDVKLTPEEAEIAKRFGYTPEEYAKYKE
jgi:ribonucleoside-triphosphate reductase